MLETKDLILAKAKFEDWRTMYRNVWSRPETARFMLWKVTENEEEAKARMHRTILYQETHEAFLIYEKLHGQAIGFAGIGELEPGIYTDTGIAIGPEFVGRGYGKQTLELLLRYCSMQLHGKEFRYTTRSENAASKALALSCGFIYQYSREKMSESGERYEIETYIRKLERS